MSTSKIIKVFPSPSKLYPNATMNTFSQCPSEDLSLMRKLEHQELMNMSTLSPVCKKGDETKAKTYLDKGN